MCKDASLDIVLFIVFKGQHTVAAFGPLFLDPPSFFFTYTAVGSYQLAGNMQAQELGKSYHTASVEAEAQMRSETRLQSASAFSATCVYGAQREVQSLRVQFVHTGQGFSRVYIWILEIFLKVPLAVHLKCSFQYK